MLVMVGKVLSELEHIFVGKTGQTLMLLLIDMLYIKQEQIRHCCQLLKLGEEGFLRCERSAGRIQTGVHTFFLCKLKQTGHEVDLHHALTTADGDTSVLPPV